MLRAIHFQYAYIGWIFIAIDVTLLGYQILRIHIAEFKLSSLLPAGFVITLLIWNSLFSISLEPLFFVAINGLGLLIVMLTMLALNLLQGRRKTDGDKEPGPYLGSNLPEGLPASARQYNLTRREGEVVLLIRRGYRYKAIADKLFIAERTVDKHVRNIFEKVGVNNKQALIYKLFDNDASAE